MTARELFEAIGLVDEELIADADAPVRRRWTPRLVLRRALPLAACLCVAAGAVIAWRIAPWQGMTGSSIQNEAAAAPDLAAAPEQAGAGEDGSEAAAAAPKETDGRDSLAADQAGTDVDEVPFGLCCLYYVARVDAHRIENLCQLIHQCDIDVALCVLDYLGGLGHLD